jgi:hypothetical protein
VQPLGDRLEFCGALGVELNVDGPLVGDGTLDTLLELERGALDLDTLDLNRAQDVLDGRLLVRGRLARDQRLGRIRALLLVRCRIGAVQRLELLVDVRGDPVRVTAVLRLGRGLGELRGRRALLRRNGSAGAVEQDRAEVHVG